jgi:hypothetical protein
MPSDNPSESSTSEEPDDMSSESDGLPRASAASELRQTSFEQQEKLFKHPKRHMFEAVWKNYMDTDPTSHIAELGGIPLRGNFGNRGTPCLVAWLYYFR